ncbi:ATP-binding cassette domain-containing protein [Pseudactinotalea sp. Z1732]|uniref:ATP-binding cassette domain-containing protein n=1 Tax=Pseudactinotalea sp. Z1732 TaxID=3413026 RepID=UPI003C7E1687
MSPLLRIQDLSVTFDGVGRVLREVSVSVAAGECVAVVGESGAGKSVLARTALGLAGEGGVPAQIRAGVLDVLGQDARSFTPRHWRRIRGAQVAMVLQDALGSLDPLRTVGAEVAETLAVRGVPSAQRRERVLQALTDAGLDQPHLRAQQRPAELSGGMRQRALIASALAGGPQLLVADEPTTALDATVAATILDLLARLRDEGMGILLVSHDLGAVSRVADRIVVLAQGQLVEAGTAMQVLTAPEQPYTRELMAAVPRGPKAGTSSTGAQPDGAGGARPKHPGSGEAGAWSPVLAARGLVRRFRLPSGGSLAAVDGVDLQVRPGEAIGVVGESGSGKTTLARLLLAAEEPDEGEVDLAGEAWSGVPERDRRSRRRQIQYIPQDPLGSMDPRHRAGQILRRTLDRARSSRTPAELLARVGLPEEALNRYPRALSGGQRQRLAIARALAGRPKVLVCDEPVSALDVTVQAQILDLLTTVQATEGVALVFISHDLAVVRRVCETVLVMRAGKVIESGPLEQVYARPEQDFTRQLLAAAPNWD